jgi:hypothetical protein
VKFDSVITRFDRLVHAKFMHENIFILFQLICQNQFIAINSVIKGLERYRFFSTTLCDACDRATA